MTKKITLSLLAIVVSSCVLISAGLIVGAFFLLKAQKNYTPPVETAEPLTIDEQMDQIQEQVSDLRGLNLKNPLDRAMMTTDELKDVVVNDFFVDYPPEEAATDADFLSVLGLVEPGFDLLQFYKDLYSEQIAGYYDSETKEMYVIADEGFGGLERMTYAHEFTHVLQDQTYDLENGLMINEDYCDRASEYCSAVTALIEGDAVLSEQYWFLRDSTDQDKIDVSDFQTTYVSPVYDSAPEYMKQDFLFPYQQGFAFVNYLYGDNGWRSVDKAYKNPPITTEQIMHPEKYPEDRPIKVTLPDLSPILGEGWSEYDSNVMGEWYTYLMLSAGVDPQTRLSETNASEAAAGWGGDAYVYYIDEKSDHYVFAWLSSWDTLPDSDDFYAAGLEYGILRWGDGSNDDAGCVSWKVNGGPEVTIRQSGNDVLWLISDDSKAFDQTLNAFKDFR